MRFPCAAAQCAFEHFKLQAAINLSSLPPPPPPKNTRTEKMHLCSFTLSLSRSVHANFKADLICNVSYWIITTWRDKNSKSCLAWELTIKRRLIFSKYPHNYCMIIMIRFCVPISLSLVSQTNIYVFDAALQVNADTPTEAECRPYIAKALNTLKGDNKGIKRNKWQRTCSFCDVLFLLIA